MDRPYEMSAEPVSYYRDRGKYLSGFSKLFPPTRKLFPTLFTTFERYTLKTFKIDIFNIY